MNYPFYCPKCGHKETITMSMKEYTGEGHMCPECGEEMKREIDSMVCRSIDKTGDFYRSFNQVKCAATVVQIRIIGAIASAIGSGFKPQMIHLGHYYFVLDFK